MIKQDRQSRPARLPTIALLSATLTFAGLGSGCDGIKDDDTTGDETSGGSSGGSWGGGTGTTGTGTTSGVTSGTGVGSDASTGMGTATESGTTGDNGDPYLTGPCVSRIRNPGRIVVTSTDRSTGAIGWIDVATGVAHNDLQFAGTDTALAYDGAQVYVINRFMADYVQVLSSDLRTEHAQFKVEEPGVDSTNPHAIAFDGHGFGYVTAYGSSKVQRWNLSNPSTPVFDGSIDLGAFADADGIPEVSMAVTCGDTLVVSVERIDRNNDWSPVDYQYLVPVHGPSGRLFNTAEGDGIEYRSVRLLGRGILGHVADPSHATGHGLLLLSSGIERIDLAAGTSTWAIPEDVFTNAGFGPFALGGFDLAADNDTVYISATNPEWTEHSVWRATLSSGGADLTKVIGNLSSTSRSMRVAGNYLFYADDGPATTGVRVFDISSATPTELGHSPIDTALPPYGLMGI